MQTPQTNEPDFDDGKLQAPEKLVSALKNLPAEPVFIPLYVNETVLRAARERLEKPPGKNLFRWWIAWAAAAAAIVLVAGLAHVFTKSDSHKEFVREDINRDGRMDILDAFALARQIESNQTNHNLDFNSDGAVDRRDSQAIANRAVQLEKDDRS